MEAVIAIWRCSSCVPGPGRVRDGEGRRRRQAGRGPHGHAGPPHGRGDDAQGQELRAAGVAGELAQLRLKLRTSMRATQDALHARVAEDASLSESLDLFQRLSVHGRELDDELKRLEREPDRATSRRAAARACASARSGSRTRPTRCAGRRRDRARQFADDDLDSLSAQIDIEAGALRHWTTERRPSPRQTPPPWPEAPAPSAPAGAPDLAGDSAGPRQAEPPDRARASPRRPAAHLPLAEEARPESTNYDARPRVRRGRAAVHGLRGG